MNSLIEYTCDYKVNDNRPFSQKLATLLDTTIGRDKLFRLIQYYVKFILPFIKDKNEYLKVVSFLEGIGGASNLVRKMLRLGKHVNCYRNIINRFKKDASSIEFNDYLKSLSDLFNCVYFFLDHILLLNKINAIKIENTNALNKIDWYGNLFWGGECLTNLIYDIVDYVKNARELRGLINSLKKIQGVDSVEYINLRKKISLLKYELLMKIIDMLRCLTDMPLIVHFLTSDKVVPNSVAGLFGVVSSLIGIYQKW